jgi:hypothetical protein
MRNDNIDEIKKRLKLAYPSYKFEISFNAAIPIYNIYVFKDGRKLSSLSFSPETSMIEFWGNIQEWMRHLVR